MSIARREAPWRRCLKALLRSVGRVLPKSVQLRVARNRPWAAWVIQPGQMIVHEQFLGRYTIEAHTDSKIERQMLSGTYEPHLQRVLDEHVQPGHVCLDIGANVGAMSLSLARRVGAEGVVHAFEPAPMLFQRLTRNIGLNQVLTEDVFAHNVGIGATPGELHWLQSSAGEGNGRLLDHAAPESVRVDVTTLDAFVCEHDVQQVDFIKIDVERMELEVVRGGCDVLREHRPVVLFETLPCYGIAEHERRTGELLAIFRELGYGLWNVDRRRQRPIGASELPNAHESLAVPK